MTVFAKMISLVAQQNAVSTIDNVQVDIDIFLEKENGCFSLMKVLVTFDPFSYIGSSVIYRP